MGNRVAIKGSSIHKRVSGVQLETRVATTSIRVSKFNKSWLVLANKLDSLGWLESVSISNGRVILESLADPEVIEQAITGHRARPRRTKSIGISLVALVLIPLSLVPLGKPAKVAAKSVEVTKSNPCSESSIEEWLKGNPAANSPIKAKETSILGGVTAGILECETSRYSYTLESKEPKRVLNLRKLDS